MDRYREIRELVINCSRGELKTIHKHIESLSNPKSSQISKSRELIDAIREFPESSEVEILNKIKFDTKAKNISLFYRSTRGVINEALILEENIDKQFEYSNSFRNKSAGRKKLILAEILLKKGMSEIGNLMLEEVISRSSKYEEFDQVIEAYEFLKLKSIISGDIKEFDTIDKSLEEAEIKRDAIHKSKKLYQNVLMYSNMPLPKAYKASIDVAVKKIGELSKKGNSDTVDFLLDLTEAEQFKIANKFTEASDKYNDLLIDVRTKAALQSTEREAQILIKLGNCLVQNGEYKKAKSTYGEASDHFKKSDYDHYLLQSKIVYLDFYLKNYNELKRTFNLRTKSRYITTLPYAVAQYDFFNGVLLYAKSKTAAAAKWLLAKAAPTPNISYETQLGLNFLLLITGIELLPKNKSLSKRSLTEAFKNIEDIKAVNTFSKRDRMLLRIFKKLRNRDYDFEVTRPVIEDDLKKLSEDQEYAWEPFSYEVFRFDDWVKARLKS